MQKLRPAFHPIGNVLGDCPSNGIGPPFSNANIPRLDCLDFIVGTKINGLPKKRMLVSISRESAEGEGIAESESHQGPNPFVGGDQPPIESE